jgi:hypothetical protein
MIIYNIIYKMFFVVGTLAGGACAACLREDQQQKTAGLYLILYPSPAVWWRRASLYLFYRW